MDLSPYIATLREHLTTAASAGDEQTARSTAMLSAALEPAARLAIMNALSDLSAEVTSQLDDDVVDVRLDGKDVRVVVTHTGPTQAEAEPEETPQPPPSSGEGDISRITVRLLEELKGNAEQAASEQGLSLNAFVAQAVQGAIAGKARGKGPWGHGGPGHAGPGHGDRRGGKYGGRPGSRVQGWVQG